MNKVIIIIIIIIIIKKIPVIKLYLIKDNDNYNDDEMMKIMLKNKNYQKIFKNRVYVNDQS